MRTNRANYLSNLPTTDSLSSKTIHAYKKLLEDLIMTSDNTNDEDLIDFKKRFIIYTIDNFNKYGIDYLHEEYFPVRKNLCLLREDVIKNNKDSLIELITDKDKLKETITKLDNIYRFNERYKRIKIDGKFQEIKKDIKTSDLPLYIKEINSKKDLIVGKISNYYKSNDLSISELEQLLGTLTNEEIINNILDIYNQDLLIFKDCGIELFENLYKLYKIEVLDSLKRTLTGKLITKYEKENRKDKEIFHYMRTLKKVNGQI